MAYRQTHESAVQERAPRDRSTATSTFTRAQALLAAIAAIIVCLATALPASAGTTNASTLTKTGTDESTGASVSSGGASAQTSPGDTIDWVLHYSNDTGSAANVTIKDPIAANQTFVSGSLLVPPGTGLSPEWSNEGAVRVLRLGDRHGVLGLQLARADRRLGQPHRR